MGHDQTRFEETKAVVEATTQIPNTESKSLFLAWSVDSTCVMAKSGSAVSTGALKSISRMPLEAYG